MTTEEQEQTQGKDMWTWKNLVRVVKDRTFWLGVVVLGVFLFVVVPDNPDWIYPYLGLTSENGAPTPKNEALKFLGLVMGGILFILQVWASHKRAKAMEETANAQARATNATEQGQRQERLKNAIEHLGHDSDYVRLGGAYELFHLAEETKELRKTALDMFCAHIRRTTGEAGYREQYKAKPSEEVQSLLTLLFVQDHQVFKGLQANLQGSFLNGADLNKARLQGANLRGAHLQGTYLGGARLPGANLEEAHLQRANLHRARLQEADLRGADLPGADLWGADLRGAVLNGADLRGAVLNGADLRGAVLNGADLRGAVLRVAHLQGAVLNGADLRGAVLRVAHLQGAVLNGARLQGADLNGAHLEGADLNGAHLQAATLSYANLRGAGEYSVRIHDNKGQDFIIKGLDAITEKIFAEHMKECIGKESDLSGVVFEGGLSREDVDSIVEDLPDLSERVFKVEPGQEDMDMDSLVKDLSDKQANALRSKLEPHVGRPKIKGVLPKDCGAKLGTYSKEEAEQWIAEYNKAMSEVPKEQ